MPNFYTTVIRRDPRFNSTTPVHDLGLLEPGTRMAVTALLADARSQGMDLRSTETYRSQALQEKYFDEGKTQLRRVGLHGYGLACDFALYVDGVYQDKAESYSFLAKLAPKHGLVSGYDWGLPHIEHEWRDADHVQRVYNFREHVIFNGDFYPPQDFDPHKDAVENGVKDI